ncbi:hypothetical protein GCM10009116_25570 [Brevundimonas basaltis]|uniref:Uncharacterized protein n=1 Tax=Brevundimonas basaltis TaxID=472166 RepID=A0A7W8HZ29_9CAUL|nr:hypothetical protein [Brevundimonas basaltis]MBB5291572.1 hypothetical protein [Brevundimonas basaltis]
MSAIRPPVPSPLFPAQNPPSPVRASRSDFFRAALDAVGAPAGTPPAAPSAATQATRAAEDRPQRPGALLDIRV